MDEKYFYEVADITKPRLFISQKTQKNATENNYFHLEIRIFSYFRPWYFTQKYINDR